MPSGSPARCLCGLEAAMARFRLIALVLEVSRDRQQLILSRLVLVVDRLLQSRCLRLGCRLIWCTRGQYPHLRGVVEIDVPLQRIGLVLVPGVGRLGLSQDCLSRGAAAGEAGNRQERGKHRDDDGCTPTKVRTPLGRLFGVLNMFEDVSGFHGGQRIHSHMP